MLSSSRVQPPQRGYNSVTKVENKMYHLSPGDQLHGGKYAKNEILIWHGLSLIFRDPAFIFFFKNKKRIVDKS